MKNYYQILKVPPSSKLKDIRTAFRKLSLELHPDVNPSETAKNQFIEVNEAYSVLKDAVRRAHYDKLLNSSDNKRQTKWEQDVNRSATRGQRQGQKYAEKPREEFENKRFRWGWGIFDIIIELFFALLRN